MCWRGGVVVVVVVLLLMLLLLALMGGTTFAGKNMADGVEVGPWAKTDGSGSAKLGEGTSDGKIRW